jgi:hypothetical protein
VDEVEAAVTALVFYVALVVSTLLGARSFACPRAWYAFAARADGTFRCGSPWPQALCDTVHGCSDSYADTTLVGVLACRPVIDFDGRGVHCS